MSNDTPTNPSRPPNYPFKAGFRPPSRTGAIGMFLFLAALFMLFAAGLLGYVVIRLKSAEKFPMGQLHLPTPLWVSTGLVVIASITVQQAVSEVSHERQQGFRRWLAMTMLLAVAFVIVQTPSMVGLLHNQKAMLQQKLALYGFVFTLILLHALHVIGGVIALARTLQQARRGLYDHEHYQPVRFVALYWHFLDAVWLTMFITFLLMR